MATYSQPLPNHDNGLFWAITLSIALHTLAAFILPNIEFDTKKPPETLIVEIARPKQAEPSPVATPEPVQSEPTPPQPVIKPPPVIKQKPIPQPSPIAEPPSNPAPEITTPSPSPAVITAAPKADSPPVITAPVAAPLPPPEPAKPVGPSQQDIDAARNQYGSLLAREIAKYKQYPKVAQMRGWQGDVMLELHLDSNGNVLSAKVHDSSSYEVLDKQTLEMVKKASPFPLPPEALRGRSFTILVPVSFRLEQ